MRAMKCSFGRLQPNSWRCSTVRIRTTTITTITAAPAIPIHRCFPRQNGRGNASGIALSNEQVWRKVPSCSIPSLHSHLCFFQILLRVHRRFRMISGLAKIRLIPVLKINTFIGWTMRKPSSIVAVYLLNTWSYSFNMSSMIVMMTHIGDIVNGHWLICTRSVTVRSCKKHSIRHSHWRVKARKYNYFDNKHSLHIWSLAWFYLLDLLVNKIENKTAEERKHTYLGYSLSLAQHNTDGQREREREKEVMERSFRFDVGHHQYIETHRVEQKQMDRQWHIRQQLELLSSPTSIQYHRIESYSSIVEGVQRVRRILAGDKYPGW